MRRFAIAAVFLFAPAAATAGPGEQPGQKFQVRIEDLPKPYATGAVANSAERIDRPAVATLRVPAGFRADLFADGLEAPREIAIAPNGDVFVTQSRDGSIVVLRDANKDGRADQTLTYAEDFARPHGMLFHGGWLYVADTAAVWRLAYRSGDTKAGARVALSREGAFGDPRGHWTRNIVLSADEKTFFIAIGSRSNRDEEAAPRATIQTMPVAGGPLTTFASGLRNPAAIARYPGTADLYTVVNERDGLGDGLVPDYLTRVDRGAFYGWPYAYLSPRLPDPDNGPKRPDLVAKTKAPDVLFQSHSAPVGLAFYGAEQFPERYRGGAFVSLHGSWNSSVPTGYKVVFVPFANGRPAANAYENFATGFWQSGTEQAHVWGRPVGLAVAADGALLVADDAGGAVWRIAYVGGK
jgi:glucose/arabinose dehydrogenase